MLTIETIDKLEPILMYVAPVAGGAIASFFGYRADSPTRAMFRTIFLTICFSFAIALAAGAVIDFSLANQQWQRWDALWLPLLQLPVGALAGLVYALIVMPLVNRRIEKTASSSNALQTHDS